MVEEAAGRTFFWMEIHSLVIVAGLCEDTCPSASEP